MIFGIPPSLFLPPPRQKTQALNERGHTWSGKHAKNETSLPQHDASCTNPQKGTGMHGSSNVTVSGFEAGLAVFMCTQRVVFASFVFRRSPLSLLCSCAHRWVPVSFPFTCACRGIARWVLLLLFSSYSYSASFVFVCVKLKRLRLSRQAVKFGHVALFECFNEPGWATTGRCDSNTEKAINFVSTVSFAWLMMALTPKRLFLSLCVSISLLRPYTFFSRSPLVFKTLFENACEL